jgi:hypothetical protein
MHEYMNLDNVLPICYNEQPTSTSLLATRIFNLYIVTCHYDQQMMTAERATKPRPGVLVVIRNLRKMARDWYPTLLSNPYMD